jgi:hypothetical protein
MATQFFARISDPQKQKQDLQVENTRCFYTSDKAKVLPYYRSRIKFLAGGILITLAFLVSVGYLPKLKHWVTICVEPLVLVHNERIP